MSPVIDDAARVARVGHLSRRGPALPDGGRLVRSLVAAALGFGPSGPGGARLQAALSLSAQPPPVTGLCRARGAQATPREGMAWPAGGVPSRPSPARLRAIAHPAGSGAPAAPASPRHGPLRALRPPSRPTAAPTGDRGRLRLTTAPCGGRARLAFREGTSACLCSAFVLSRAAHGAALAIPLCRRPGGLPPVQTAWQLPPGPSRPAPRRRNHPGGAAGRPRLRMPLEGSAATPAAQVPGEMRCAVH